MEDIPKRRRGEDFHCSYEFGVAINNINKPLDELDLSVILTDSTGKELAVKYTCTEKTIEFDFFGIHHMSLGKYRLSVFLNKDGIGQGIEDVCNAFELVPYSCCKNDIGGKITITDTVKLKGGTLNLVQGYSFYGSWLNSGHDGTEADMVEYFYNPIRKTIEQCENVIKNLIFVGANAENVNARLDGTTLFVTDRYGNTTSKDLKGKDGYTPVKGKDYFDGNSLTYDELTDEQKAELRGKDGKDGAPIYPTYTVNPVNMHLYVSVDDNKISVNGSKHLVVRY